VPNRFTGLKDNGMQAALEGVGGGRKADRARTDDGDCLRGGGHSIYPSGFIEI
jgi:hypothetical protein